MATSRLIASVLGPWHQRESLWSIHHLPLGLIAAMIAAICIIALASAQRGRQREKMLAAEQSQLEISLSAAVITADYDRHRIERTLRAGAQQRLVALAASVEAARENLATDPEIGRQMVAEAHKTAMTALTDLRNLVRDIHPVILEDRGLAAALSAVIARSPVPVTIDISVAERLPAAVESTAYFVVSEALAHMTHDNQPTCASVTITRDGNNLVIEIRHDGACGDRSTETDLQHTRERVTALRGSMIVLSPPGGPTTMTIELPCEP